MTDDMTCGYHHDAQCLLFVLRGSSVMFSLHGSTDKVCIDIGAGR